MPELPEIAAHAERLEAGWTGATLSAVEPLSAVALKTVDPPVDAGVDARVAGVGRRGKHLLVRMDTDPPVSYVIHLMQGGRLRTEADSSRRPNSSSRRPNPSSRRPNPSSRRPNPSSSRPNPSSRPRGGLLRWRFEDAEALLLTEAGTERRAGVWVVRGDPAGQAPLAELGPDADTLAGVGLAARLAEARGRLHTVLRDQRVLAGLGRRLANEICHAARRSPFQPVDHLSADDVADLAAAMHGVLDRELADERAAGEMRRGADRSTAVHGRTGEPCPACGDEVREVRYSDYTIHYCAACQTGGKVLADNTTSKFLR